MKKRVHSASTRRSKSSIRASYGRRVGKVEPLESRLLLALVFGDFNRDGFDDMAVGVPGEDIGAIVDAGAVHVVYGTNSGLSAADDEFWHQNSQGVDEVAEEGDGFGSALAAGDFNGDGYDDLAVGAPFEDLGPHPDAGVVHVLYGFAGGLSSQAPVFTIASPTLGSPATLLGRDDQLFHQDSTGIVNQAEAFDRFGEVLTTGDYNGDGYADLAVGVPHENVHPFEGARASSDAGVVHVIYGSSSGLTDSGLYEISGRLGTIRNDTFHQFKVGVGDQSQPTEDYPEDYDFFGSALATGDFNRDGRDDLAVGVPGEDLQAIDEGAVSILYGSPRGIQIDGDRLFSAADWDEPVIFQGAGGVRQRQPFSNFGSALAAGDFNGDGVSDLAIGSPNEDRGLEVDTGVVRVMYGVADSSRSFNTGFSRHQMFDQGTPGIAGASETGDALGATLVAGDFNGDGRDDLAMGKPGESISGRQEAGAVNVMYGSRSGLTAAGDRVYHQNTRQIRGIAEFSDYFGATLAAGDANGDGRVDLAVGVPSEGHNSIDDAGHVLLLYASTGQGFRTDNEQVWHQNVNGITSPVEHGDSFGGNLPGSIAGGVPDLQSRPESARHLFLDFDGGVSLGLFTPRFDVDNAEAFSRTEQALIEDIWAIVAEDYAPFNVNVTTVHPGRGEVYRVLIGGLAEQRGLESGRSGVAPGVGFDTFVFSQSILNHPAQHWRLAERVGNTASHEAGHGYGLSHKNEIDRTRPVWIPFLGFRWSQIDLDGDGRIELGGGDDDYSPGGETWTPIMGQNLSLDRVIWTQNNAYIGEDLALDLDGDFVPDPVYGPNRWVNGNNDFEHLANRLGRVGDDHWDFPWTHPIFTHLRPASIGTLSPSETLAGGGIIENRSDVDVFRFTVSSSSRVTVSVQTPEIGANLDSTLRLMDSRGRTIQHGIPSGALEIGSTLTNRLPQGTYFVAVGSVGRFTGDVGRYTVRVQSRATTGLFPPGGGVFYAPSAVFNSAASSNTPTFTRHRSPTAKETPPTLSDTQTLVGNATFSEDVTTRQQQHDRHHRVQQANETFAGNVDLLAASSSLFDSMTVLDRAD